MPDKQLLLEFALDTYDRITSLVASLDDDTANADLGHPGSSTPYALLTSCLAVLGHAAGDTAASGRVPELLERASYVRAAFVDEVAGLDLDAEPQRHRDLLEVVRQLAQHLGRLEATRDGLAARGGVRQLRLVVEADDYDRALGFYRDVLGLREASTYRGRGDQRGVILDAGHATLELHSPAQRREVDRIEVGHTTESPIRVALEVADAERTTLHLLDAGAVVIAPAVTTPWSTVTARFQAPAGLELTVFQER